jgi:hypothetical protein
VAVPQFQKGIFIMNASSKILSSALIAMASLSAASAFANDSEYPVAQAANTTVSSTTRAQVRAEYLQAKREGTLIQSDDSYPTAASTQSSGKTRAEVQAELNNAVGQGFSPRIDNQYPQG